MIKIRKGLFTVCLFLLTPFIFSDSIFGKNSDYKVSTPKYDVLMEMNVKIPMRDGIKLAIDIFRPSAEGKFPVILVRTPYGSEIAKYSDKGKYFARRGYVYTVQDCRGKHDSEGDWDGQRSETKDGYDTLNWLGTQPWSSGSVGMMGASYLGLVQWQVSFTQNPYLKALVPMVAPVTLNNVPYECLGASKSPLGLSWLVTTDGRINQNVDAYDWEKIFWHLPLFELPELLGRNIPFWEKSLRLKRGFWEEYLLSAAEGKWTEKIEQKTEYENLYEKVQVPIMQITGWFDGSSGISLYNYNQVKRMSKNEIGKNNQRIIIGPWSHFFNVSSTVGSINFGENSVIDLDNMVLRWFDKWLKDIPNGIEKEAPLFLFLMGKNEWREVTEWPLPNTKYVSYYLHSSGSANSLNGSGKLSIEVPDNELPDTYIYDPADPTPAITDGENMTLAASGPEDIRHIENREDVLTYTSPILKKDLEVTGDVSFTLYVSTSAPETDFIVRLLDVHPNGKSYSVYCTYTGGMSTRCVQSYEDGPNGEKILKLESGLMPTSQLFLAGHRIRIDICSAAFPLVRNLNTGKDYARGTEINVANQVIYHDHKYASHIVLPVVPPQK